MWSLHDRLENYISEENCKTEIESVLKHGQLVPVLGRALRGDPDHDVELICGARRLFVARHVNQPLLVELSDLSDRQAIVAMDLENRHRTDISAYERGLGYARWLKAGHFKSQEEIASVLRTSASQVSRLLKLVQLPQEIVAAFGGPKDIYERWGRTLMQVMEHPVGARLTISRANAIAKMPTRPSPIEVYRQLLAAAALTRGSPSTDAAEVIKDPHGSRLFRIKYQSRSVVILLPVASVSAMSLDRIRREVASILQEEKRNPLDDSDHRRRKTVPSKGEGAFHRPSEPM
jgi:ParB family chromosome partitioning protein